MPALFDGRSQLLIYHLMFGEVWAVDCPGCSSFAYVLFGVFTHLFDRDVELLCMPHKPLEQLSGQAAYAFCPPGDSPQAVDRRTNAGECASTVAGIPTQ